MNITHLNWDDLLSKLCWAFSNTGRSKETVTYNISLTDLKIEKNGKTQ